MRSLLQRKRFAILSVFLGILVMTTSAGAQWLHHPDPRAPRNPDGTANLSAAAPRLQDGTPDFSGIWGAPSQKYLVNLGADGIEIPMQPWAAQLYKERQDNNSKDSPSSHCLPHGVTDFDSHMTPRKIIQQPGLMVMLFESYHSYRQIFTDGRSLPEDREPAWFGYSVGRWEGDVLIVDTVGINEATWLDDGGHPHSEALHIIERFRRTDYGHMDLELTIDDPKAYVKPWTVHLGWNLMPDTDLLDWVCLNEKDRQHMVGK